jgi:ABC-2 type transport system ATP-binding protein
VVASHLLGEIERICDGLVAIEAGHLLRADTLESFTRSSQTLLIEVEEGTQALAAELGRRGLYTRPYQRGLLVQIDGEETYDAVRDAVAALGLPLSRMEQRRHQVEEIFRDDPQVDQFTQMEDADAR